MSLNFYLEAEHKYDTNMIKKRHKVDRCLARYSPRAITTNQLTNRAPNEPARPICAQKSIFLDKSGHFYSENHSLRHLDCIVLLVGQKSLICHTTQKFVNGQFVAHSEAVRFAPWD